MACEEEQTQVAVILVENGADISLKNKVRRLYCRLTAATDSTCLFSKTCAGEELMTQSVPHTTK